MVLYLVNNIELYYFTSLEESNRERFLCYNHIWFSKLMSHNIYTLHYFVNIKERKLQRKGSEDWNYVWTWMWWIWIFLMQNRERCFEETRFYLKSSTFERGELSTLYKGLDDILKLLTEKYINISGNITEFNKCKNFCNLTFENGKEVKDSLKDAELFLLEVFDGFFHLSRSTTFI